MENPNSKNTTRKEEIDDFARALLEKKTEMKIYESSKPIQSEISQDDRREAEKTLSSALDLLRKERGQSTIAEEEQRFAYSMLQEEEEEDFTSSNFEQMRTQSFDVTSINKALHEYDTSDVPSSKLKLDLNKGNAKGISHDLEQEQPKKEVKKKPKRNKKRLIAIFACIFVLAACLGGYAYKVYVWNPAHLVTDEMQKSYDKLVAYADEYGSDLESDNFLMSDSERLELLDMDKDYEILNSTLKSDINTYFEEQTKMTYTELRDSMEEFQTALNDEANASYHTIVELLNNYSSLTNEQKYQLIDLQSSYEALPKILKERIDDLAQSSTDADIASLVKQLSEQRAQDQQAQAQDQQQLASLQSQLSSLQAQLESYQEYATTLSQELANAADSQTVSDLESAISANNQTISRLQAQIASVQEQIESLQKS